MSNVLACSGRPLTFADWREETAFEYVSNHKTKSCGPGNNRHGVEDDGVWQTPDMSRQSTWTDNLVVAGVGRLAIILVNTFRSIARSCPCEPRAIEPEEAGFDVSLSSPQLVAERDEHPNGDNRDQTSDVQATWRRFSAAPCFEQEE